MAEDFAKLQVTIEASLKDFTAKMGEFEKIVQSTSKNTGTNFGSLIGKFGDLKGALLGLAGPFAAVGTAAGAVSFLKNAHEDAQKARLAINQLTASLGYYSAALVKQAETLERTHFIHAEEVMSAQRSLSFYFKEENQIKKLIPTVMDLANAKGMNLASAANMVAVQFTRQEESARSNDIVLRSLGIRFEKTGDQSKDFARLVDELDKKFHGQTQAVTDSLDGWSKLSFWIGIAAQKTGEFIFGVAKAKEEAHNYAAEQKYLIGDMERLPKLQEALAKSIEDYPKKTSKLQRDIAITQQSMIKNEIEMTQHSIKRRTERIQAYEATQKAGVDAAKALADAERKFREQDEKDEDAKRERDDIARKREITFKDVRKATFDAEMATLELQHTQELLSDKEFIEQKYALQEKMLETEVIMEKDEQSRAQIVAARRLSIQKLEIDKNKELVALDKKEKDKKEKEQEKADKESEEDAQRYYADTLKEYQEFVNTYLSIAEQLGSALGGAFIKGFSDQKDVLKDTLKSILNIMLDFLEKKLVLAKLAAIAQFITDFGISIFLLGGIPQIVGEFAALAVGFAAAKAAVAAFASGGLVEGGSHAIGGTMVNVEGGEFVHSRYAVDRYGARAMDALNRGLVPATALAPYNAGGASPAIAGGSKTIIANFFDPTVFKQFLRSEEGKRALVNHLSENSFYVKKAMAIA